MLSAAVVVGVPSVFAFIGWLCHQEGYTKGRARGYADGHADGWHDAFSSLADGRK